MYLGTNYRLAGALILSIVMHILLIAPWRWPAGNKTASAPLYVLGSLARTPSAEVQPDNSSALPTSEVAKRPDRQNGKAKKKVRTALPGKTARSSDSAEIAERAEALVLDQVLLPEYPERALELGLEGCVLSSVLVSAGGEVESVSIMDADHPGVFDQAVIDAQKSARYAPALRGGKGISSRVLAVSAFVLRPDKQLDCPLKYLPQAEAFSRGVAP